LAWRRPGSGTSWLARFIVRIAFLSSGLQSQVFTLPQ
jgi:hypothetical protein